MIRFVRTTGIIVMLGLLCSPLVKADVSMPKIFGDNMILQQEIGAPIWGWADPGEKVLVSGSWGNQKSVVTGNDGS
jgi:sialate O-acetylesterase